jgi:hypothetical protein
LLVSKVETDKERDSGDEGSNIDSNDKIFLNLNAVEG